MLVVSLLYSLLARWQWLIASYLLPWVCREEEEVGCLMGLIDCKVLDMSIRDISDDLVYTNVAPGAPL